MTLHTARLQLPKPEEGESPDGPVQIGALADALDNAAIIDRGTLAQRPVSTPAVPGIAGRFFIVDDQAGGDRLDMDIGVAWVTVGPAALADGSVTNVKLADDSVDERVLAPASVGTPELIDGGVSTAKVAAKAIDTTKIADALKPSVAAGGGTEALRAIGAAAGQVVGGDDARLADARTPLAHRVSHGIAGADALFGSGTLAARPAANTLPNGFVYFSTDDQGGRVAMVIGGAWVNIANSMNGTVPIGTMVPWAGTGDPNGSWMLADGRLIDRTTFATFFAQDGHAHNGGVDPGSNMVRIPDARGRTIIGTDDMGTAQGASGRIPNSNRGRGQNGGEERHTTTDSENPSHTHPTTGVSGGQFATGNQSGSSFTAVQAASPATGSAFKYVGYLGAASAINSPTSTGSDGGGNPHNNMQPYEVDNWIVRVL